MSKNTKHYIKIQKWENNILVIEELPQPFETEKAAKVFCIVYSNKPANATHKLKVYNYLGEVVFTHQGPTAPPITSSYA